MSPRAEMAVNLAVNYKRYGTCYPEKLVQEALELADQVEPPETREKLLVILQRLLAGSQAASQSDRGSEKV